MNSTVKVFIRKVFRYFFLIKYFVLRNRINRASNGSPLKKGISAVISMKDEEYTIEACIRSLHGFADQIICIDNGSTDKTVKIVQHLIRELSHVELVEMPGALLGDCRNEGLKRTKYNWHLRWDADMIAHTDGPNTFVKLRDKILKSDIPKTLQLPRINLNGDFYHTVKGKTSDAGEPILMRYTRDIIYKEYGKFDTIKVPFYYKQIQEEKNYYMHCQGLKSDENLLHRFHYFVWRQYSNENTEFKLSQKDFFNKRNLYYFDTTDTKRVNYRYQRQNVQIFEKYEIEDFIDYPKEIKKLMNKNDRFKIIYKDLKPFYRMDSHHKLMSNFEPDSEDMNWSVEKFFDKINEETIKQYIN